LPGFSIIIVTWNALHHLKEFLPSVAATNYKYYEIIIADNASDDGSAEWVTTNFPDVKVVSLDKNYGYCGGNNRAVPFAENDILIFLNNDVRVEKNWLRELAFVFENEKTAAAQPKIKSLTEPNKFEYAGAAGGFIDKYGYPFCRGRMFEEVEPDIGQYDDETEIFWASGAALAVRRELFIETGGFDEDYEFHMEEIDLCWRLQNRGWIIKYCPKSVVYHLGGGSLPMHSPRKVYYNFRNSLFTLWKNYSSSTLLLRFLPRLILDIVAAVRSLLTGNFGEFEAIARAHIDFLRGFPRIHQKRKDELKSRSKESDPATIVQKNIVLDYFLRGKKSYREFMGKKR